MPQVKALIVLMLLSTLLLSSFAPGVAAQEATPVTAGASGVPGGDASILDHCG